MGLVARWFEDYSESHLHKSLPLQSPHDFIRSY